MAQVTNDVNTFNRTIVELKCDKVREKIDSRNAFNRTIVELKCVEEALPEANENLLIVP